MLPLDIVKSDGLMLRYVEPASQTKEVCLEAVKQNGLALKYIDTGVINRILALDGNNAGNSAVTADFEIYLAAVKQNGLALKYTNIYNLEIYLAAVKQNGLALEYVSRQLLSTNDFNYYVVCIEAVKNAPRAIRYVRNGFRDGKWYENLCFLAVRKDGCSLFYIHEQYHTYKLCLEAVKAAPCFTASSLASSALKYVPDKFKTEELCLEAVKTCGYALEYVPRKLRTKEMYDLALTQDPTLQCFVIRTIHRPLLNGEECLISREPIPRGELYRMCSLKSDHIYHDDAISANSASSSCAYCKSKLLVDLFLNKI